jgi:protein-tyrosine phosphatase
MAYSQGWDMPIQELFGAINYGLAIMLQSWICVQWYHYVERDPQAWQTSIRHIMMLQQQHKILLLTLAI